MCREHRKVALLGPCSHRGVVPPLQVHPPNLPPGVQGALAVGGLCLLACFLFTDFSLLTVLASESLLMGGWVLAVRHEIPRRISKHSNLADLPTLISRVGQPPHNQPAGPRKLCLGPVVSPAPLLKGLSGLTQKTQEEAGK